MIYKKIIEFIRYCKYFSLNIIQYFKLSKNNGRKKVYFDISENFYKRYLHTFVYFFYLNDFQIFFRVRFKFIGDVHWGIREILKYNPNIRLCLFKKEADISIVDNISKKDKNSLLMTPDYFKRNNEVTSYYIPMTMYHTNYFNNIYKNKEDCAFKGNRRIKVFFAGNLEDSGYNNNVHVFYKNFNISNRLDIIHFVSEKFNGKIIIPDSYNDLSKLLKRENEIDILLVDRKKFSIPVDRFLDILSEASFFLGAPGIVMPLCHNIIEAMCVGAVPILEYSNSFIPPLEGGVNCISFRGLSDLEEKINDVLGMDETGISDIRKKTIKYYHDYLSPASVIGHIEKNRYNLEKLFLNAEHLSVDLIK